MSRIGKKPVELAKGVTASVSGQTIEVKGPKGTRSFTAGDDVTITVEGDAVKVTPRGLSKRARQQWGMTRSMIENLVTGVTMIPLLPAWAALILLLGLMVLAWQREGAEPEQHRPPST